MTFLRTTSLLRFTRHPTPAAAKLNLCKKRLLNVYFSRSSIRKHYAKVNISVGRTLSTNTEVKSETPVPQLFIQPSLVIEKLCQVGLDRNKRESSVILSGSFLGGAMISVGGALLILVGGGVEPELAQKIPGIMALGCVRLHSFEILNCIWIFLLSIVLNI